MDFANDQELALKKLFDEAFDNYGDYTKSKSIQNTHKFTCPNKDKCNTSDEGTKITSYLGDKKTKIMIVGEAPSNHDGSNIHIAGKFEDLNNLGNGFAELKQFFKDEFNEYPYFTDIVKCGLVKQKDSKRILIDRLDNCIQMFLLKEIEIMKPEKIFCQGNLAYNAIIELQENKKINKEIKIIKMLHYSRNANLPLNKEDKKLIWQLQYGKYSQSEIEEFKISKLSFIRKMITKDKVD